MIIPELKMFLSRCILKNQQYLDSFGVETQELFYTVYMMIVEQPRDDIGKGGKGGGVIIENGQNTLIVCTAISAILLKFWGWREREKKSRSRHCGPTIILQQHLNGQVYT